MVGAQLIGRIEGRRDAGITLVRLLGPPNRIRGPTPGLERFATEVELDAAGKTYHAVHDRNVLGRYENPMTRAEVEDKVLELMRPVLPARYAKSSQ